MGRSNYEDHCISMDAEAYKAWRDDGCRPSPEEERRAEAREDARYEHYYETREEESDDEEI